MADEAGAAQRAEIEYEKFRSAPLLYELSGTHFDAISQRNDIASVPQTFPS